MVKVTVELVRKHAEHHDMQLAPLKEISLHQESIEKIEHIQDWCPKLSILLLQSNLIAKIENLNKLKELEYLNLALNNVEKIENLERCESLQKFDLTLNFIGELTSILNLKDNYNLQLLYLTGNPCTDYHGYRDYVISVLPQLDVLDSLEIMKSERILALQNFPQIEEKILQQQSEYAQKRKEQKTRLEKEIETKWRTNDNNLDDEEKCKRFWNEKSEHAPETRIEMDRQSRLRRKDDKKEGVKKKERPLFNPDGRPYNINQAKLSFTFNDEDINEFKLEVHLYKHLDTSLIDIDIEPLYVRLTIKDKIFQLCLPEEINTSESIAQRSQTTGYLTLTMPKCNQKVLKIIDKKEKDKPKTEEKVSNTFPAPKVEQSRREYLEIGTSHNILDIVSRSEENLTKPVKNTMRKISLPQEKIPSSNFIDNSEVPPLI